MAAPRTFLPTSVRGRLWAALATLSAAVVIVSGLTWLALRRVDDRLQELHRQSLTRVAEAIDLSKRSSDLAASAPFLLTRSSNYLIEEEGGKLLSVLENVRADWPAADSGEAAATEVAVADITLRMEEGIRDLMDAAGGLETLQADLRGQVARLGDLREIATGAIESPAGSDPAELNWRALKSMNADALNAAYAGNLIGVGEERRYYQRQRTSLDMTALSADQAAFMAELDAIVAGTTGLFELRRRELALRLLAQNALFRIRRDANGINAAASEFAGRAEAILTGERSASSTMILYARVSVAAISLASLVLALAAALFVSRYVASNISRVSDAMARLANGDRSATLLRQEGRDDEIGDLFRSFRFFRANALRLDRSNRKLDQRNALFEKVFANISDGVAITDANGHITARNPAFDRIFRTAGLASLGAPFVDWLREGRFARSVGRDDPWPGHPGFADLKAEDGQVLELRASPLPEDGRVWLISDVTERRKLAERVEQIDRIETLGKLAGDTAHDFANVLSTIRTHAHLLSKSMPAPLDAHVAAIENAADFGASLSDRLLAFSRKQRLATEVVELNRLVSGLIDLAEIGLKDGVALEAELAEKPVEVLADPGQLEASLLNLILNANNAIEDRGTIRVEVAKNGAEVARIIVADDGCGMSPEVKMRAIEPFFTTRGKDGGTGLGLSIVYGFIKQSGGNIEIESEAGRHTRITLTLPLANARPDQAMTRHSGRALVVDDNPADLAFAIGICRTLGFESDGCRSISETKTMIEGRNFDLILSDLDLDAADDGLHLLRWAAEFHPDTRFILMSGRSGGSVSFTEGSALVGKPLTTDVLDRLLKHR